MTFFCSFVQGCIQCISPSRKQDLQTVHRAASGSDEHGGVEITHSLIQQELQAFGLIAYGCAVQGFAQFVCTIVDQILQAAHMASSGCPTQDGVGISPPVQQKS